MNLSSQGEPVELSTSEGFPGKRNVLRARLKFSVYPYPADIDFLKELSRSKQILSNR